jgi:hypothetical protein
VRNNEAIVRELQRQGSRQHIEIAAALEAHAQWKLRLDEAVRRGHCDQTAEETAHNNRCAFGVWLHALPAETQANEWFRVVHEMHARFHRYAAQVVRHVEAGRVEEALQAMGPDSDFARVSEELTLLLEEWRDAA